MATPRAPDAAAVPDGTPLAPDAAAVPDGTSPLLEVTPPEDDPQWDTASQSLFMGGTVGYLASLLWAHGRKVELRTRGVVRRLAAAAAFCILNSLLTAVDWLVHRAGVAATPLCERPVFVLGLPRSGTTLLHELLAADARLVAPDMFQVAHPSSFLVARRTRQRLLQDKLPPTRPMDNVQQTWDSPCEDEIGVSVLVGGKTYYSALSFVKYHREFLPYLTFEGPAGVAAFPRWRDALLLFCRRVLYAARVEEGAPSSGRQLLLKSPTHTAHVRLLLGLFPHAKFVYIHRHPEEVAQSSVALVRRFLPLSALAGFTAADAEAFILNTHKSLYRAYLRDRPTIPAGSLVEVPYAALTADPVGTLDTIYEGLGLDGRKDLPTTHAGVAREAVEYMAAGKCNQHQPLSPAACALLHQEWPELYEEGGYTPSHINGGSAAAAATVSGAATGATTVRAAPAAGAEVGDDGLGLSAASAAAAVLA